MTNPRRVSLSLKIGIAVLLVSSVPAAVATWVAYSQSRELLQNSIGDNLGSQADRIADELDAFHGALITRADSLADLETITAVAKGDATTEVLDAARDIVLAAVKRDERISAVNVVGGDGLVRLSSNAILEGAPLSERPWYDPALSTAVSAALYVPRGSAVSATVMDYAAPLRGGGFAIVTVHGESFWALVRQLTDRVYKGSYIVVLDGAGVRLGHGSHPQLIFRPTGPVEPKAKARLVANLQYGPRTEALLEALPEPFEFKWSTAATGGDRALQHFEPNAANQGPRFATSRRLKSVNWTIASVVPEEAVRVPVQELLVGMAWRIGLLLVGAFFIALFITQRGLDPLKRLVEAAQALSRGETPTPISNSQSDEIGELVTQFNAMVVRTSGARDELETKVRERTQALTSANEELTVQQEELKAQQEELKKKNREVEHANQLKSAFLANMSHELRTPLNSVIGFSELLSDDIGPSLDPRHQRYLKDVNGSGKHLLRLINDILDLSKIEAGHLEVHLGSVVPGDAIADARSLVGGPAHTNRITVVEEIRTGKQVLADAEKLRQVLVNLLSNAVKFSPAGAQVRLGVEEVSGGVCFFVSDDGPGIDPSYMKRLFEPFTQAENPLTKRHQGTGLGLAISRRIIERHGSSLRVESEPGKGARFSFVLPVSAGMATQPLIVSDPVRERQVVLLFESDVSRSRVLRAALQNAGFEVAVPVENEGIRSAVNRLQPVVLVVSPGRDGGEGITVLKALREGSELREIPVVMTAVPHAAGIVAKPLDADEVVAAVRRLTFGSAKVLVVDDDPRALELVTQILSSKGHSVETASGAKEALAKMRLARPDVVMTDLLMPEVSGFEFIETLAADALLRNVPVLVLSALELDEKQRSRLKRHVAALARKGDVTAREVAEAVSRLARSEDSQPTVDSSAQGGILVVDDHDLNRQLARALLERRGFNVLEASSGEEAVALARDRRPVLVLMDLAMPGMDGFAALDALKANADTTAIPVVALTAMAMKADQEAVLKAGFDGYLTKPIDAQRLDATVRTFLKK